MLEREGIEFRYREYRKQPLAAEEIRALLGKLGLAAKDLLRKRDRAYSEAGLTGEESDTQLVALMAEHPTLLQRPIGVRGERAVVGRPPERLLEL